MWHLPVTKVDKHIAMANKPVMWHLPVTKVDKLIAMANNPVMWHLPVTKVDKLIAMVNKPVVRMDNLVNRLKPVLGSTYLLLGWTGVPLA